MQTLDTHPISTLMDYTYAKEKRISFCHAKGQSDEIRRLISQGKVGGVSFPEEEEKKKHAGCQFKLPREERVYKVEAVNRLRLAGWKVADACKKLGITDYSYRHWSDNLGIERAQRPLGM